MKQAYFALGDTAKGVDILQQGFSKFPESQDIVVELINYYLTTGKADEALNYIKIAQQKDPENISLVFAEATLYDKKGEYDKAVEIYDKSIAMDPNYFNGYYNKAVLYYNRGQQYYKEADNAPLNEYKKIQELGDAQFVLAVAPMEKCMQLLEANPNPTAEDAETLRIVYETLKSVYVRIKKNDPTVDSKIQEINAKLGK
jgi:tetratricopeptide (TPR) repeat protein